jgi:hypothetical protein
LKWSTILNKIIEKLSVNNLTTTVAGKLLDARQGKALQDQITSLNTDISNGYLGAKTVTDSTADYIATLDVGCHIFYCQQASDNPVKGNMTLSVVWKASANYALQYLFSISGLRYVRDMSSGTWKDWTKL